MSHSRAISPILRLTALALAGAIIYVAVFHPSALVPYPANSTWAILPIGLIVGLATQLVLDPGRRRKPWTICLAAPVILIALVFLMGLIDPPPHRNPDPYRYQLIAVLGLGWPITLIMLAAGVSLGRTLINTLSERPS